MTYTNNVSGSILAITTITTHRRNPANIDNHRNGRQGGYYTSRLTGNIINSKKNNHICNYNNSQTPQLPVTNTSSLLKRRAARCTSSSATCGKTNFKFQNPLDHTVSTIIARNQQRASQCVINPNDAYKHATNKSFTEPNTSGNGPIQVCCSKPIVKVTDTPSTSTFLTTRYFKDNCLPPPPPPNPGSISITKRMKNKNCGNSMGGC
jgi:hypothetical protein